MADRAIDGRDNPLYWDQIIDTLLVRRSILLHQGVELRDRRETTKTELEMVNEGLAWIECRQQESRQNRQNEDRADRGGWDEVSLVHLDDALDEIRGMLSARRNDLAARQQVLEDSLYALRGMELVCDRKVEAIQRKLERAQTVREYLPRHY